MTFFTQIISSLLVISVLTGCGGETVALPTTRNKAAIPILKTLAQQGQAATLLAHQTKLSIKVIRATQGQGVVQRHPLVSKASDHTPRPMGTRSILPEWRSAVVQEPASLYAVAKSSRIRKR